MMVAIISIFDINFATLSSKLHAINPRLLSKPPPIVEQTSNDICYINPIILCKDLYFGMRGVVGSWYLSPKRIILETCIVLIIAITILITIKAKEKRRLSNHHCEHLIHRPPKAMRVATAMTFTLQIFYKVFGYRGKILIMVMPCNVIWVMNMILCYYRFDSPESENNTSLFLSYHNVAQTILQLQCSYIALVFVALLNPDFSDCVLLGEVHFYYIHHFQLLYFVMHYIFITGQVSTLSIASQLSTSTSTSTSTSSMMIKELMYFTTWILQSCSYFAIFYFGIVTPMSIVSGLNLNYMLHPPPNQNDLIGQGYRITSIGYCAVVFVIMRLMVIIMEMIWKWTLLSLLGRGKKVLHATKDVESKVIKNGKKQA